MPLLGSYGRPNMRKAWRILKGEQPLAVLGGDKVRAFYSLMINPDNSEDVCIDRHAVSLWYGSKLGDNYVKLANTPAKIN